MQNITNKLNCKCELFGMIDTLNELGENDRVEGKIKDIYCNILPQSASQKWKSPVTEVIDHSHKFICRAMSIKEPKVDMVFKFKGLKYEFIYWNPDFKNNEILEVFTKLVLE